MSNAKISIILIYKNNEDKIKYCLESIFNQKFCDYELICINNGSEDKSEEIVQEYKENRENEEVKYCLNKLNSFSFFLHKPSTIYLSFL